MSQVGILKMLWIGGIVDSERGLRHFTPPLTPPSGPHLDRNRCRRAEFGVAHYG